MNCLKAFGGHASTVTMVSSNVFFFFYSERKRRISCRFFFVREAVVRNLFCGHYTVDLPGTETLGNRLLNVLLLGGAVG